LGASFTAGQCSQIKALLISRRDLLTDFGGQRLRPKIREDGQPLPRLTATLTFDDWDRQVRSVEVLVSGGSVVPMGTPGNPEAVVERAYYDKDGNLARTRVVRDFMSS